MHSLTDIVVSAERETEVAHTTTHMRTFQMSTNPFRGSDKLQGIIIMLLNPRSDRQDIRVEDDIQRIHPHLLCQQFISTLSNLYSPLIGRSLSLFIEAHHDDSRTKALHISRMGKEDFFTLLQRNRIDDTLTLQTFQTRRDNVPFRGVNHHRYL